MKSSSYTPIVGDDNASMPSEVPVVQVDTVAHDDAGDVMTPEVSAVPVDTQIEQDVVFDRNMELLDHRIENRLEKAKRGTIIITIVFPVLLILLSGLDFDDYVVHNVLFLLFWPAFWGYVYSKQKPAAEGAKALARKTVVAVNSQGLCLHTGDMYTLRVPFSRIQSCQLVPNLFDKYTDTVLIEMTEHDLEKDLLKALPSLRRLLTFAPRRGIVSPVLLEPKLYIDGLMEPQGLVDLLNSPTSVHDCIV